jgi:membrane protein involved in colicin uptake
MGIFIVIKIAFVSLLVIYAAHMLWDYYTTNTKKNPNGNGGERINSALRDSKKMYEDMARIIQNREQPADLNTSQSTHQSIVATSVQPALHEPTTLNNKIIVPNKEDMQEELKVFMENIT